jgi:DNA-binding NarL/FixJ family response regulator
MSPLTNPEPVGTSVLLIDASDTERAAYAEALRGCSPDYRILEASSAKSGLDLYRQSSQVDCVVVDISLPGESGFLLLMDLIPFASKPHVAVIVLTNLNIRGLEEIAKRIGVYAYFSKRFTSTEVLAKAIRHAVAQVGKLPKEDRCRPI